jgi:hypothetical protein
VRWSSTRTFHTGGPAAGVPAVGTLLPALPAVGFVIGFGALVGVSFRFSRVKRASVWASCNVFVVA